MKKTITLLLATALFLSTLTGCTKASENNADSTVAQTNESTATTTSSSNTDPTPEQANPASDFEYEANEDGGMTITRYIGQSRDVVIPETIQNKPVTQIGAYAFVTKNTIRQYPSNAVHSLQMPNTITKILDQAFYQCDELKSVTLSKNLNLIDFAAFQECTQLKHVTIPAKVTWIGDAAFDSSGLETIIFEKGIEIIGGYGSFACTQLKQLVLPFTVKEIGLSTFAANPNLETVILNEGLVKIGHKAFVNNPRLKEIVIPKTVEFVTEMDFNMCSGLEKIMFEGDAPATFEYSDEISGVWEPYDVHFTIYYHEGAKGFTSPEWYGYSTQVW